MNKTYQTVVDKGKGNCMQAAIASLFDKSLEEVPNFIESNESTFKLLYEFIKKNGYTYNGYIHNKVYSQLCSPQFGCLKKEKFLRRTIITPKKLHKEQGVNGLFYASVLSPKYFNWETHTTHAVLIDKDYNIVFDPNPLYEYLLQYPLANILGFNGVVTVLIINPK